MFYKVASDCKVEKLVGMFGLLHAFDIALGIIVISSISIKGFKMNVFMLDIAEPNLAWLMISHQINHEWKWKKISL